LTGKLPFKTVYLHALVRDAHGRKMSKSLGNVIDPIEVIDGITLEELHNKLEEGNLPAKEIERAKKGQAADYPDGIPECGADALRFGLLAYTQQGRNVNLDINRVVGYRHFCNKIWNATRFGLRYFGEDFTFSGALRLDAPFAWEDKWILARLSHCSKVTNQAWERYEFSTTTTTTYSFFLHDLCDVYLELLKPRFYGDAEQGASEEDKRRLGEDRSVARDVLYICLDWSMRLMHPLLPYLTEELYQRLPKSPTKCQSITVAPYPTAVYGWVNDAVEKEMEVVGEVARQFRSEKASLGLVPSARPRGYVRHSDPHWRERLASLTERMSRMALIGEVKVLAEGEHAPKGTLRSVVNADCLIFVEVSGVDLSAEIAKLKKKVVTAERMVKAYEDKIGAPGYEERVPASVREMNSQKLEAAQIELKELHKSVANIQEAMG